MSLHAALLRTADWLEAHPNQHVAVQRTARLDGDLYPLPSDDPDTGVCYCAMGRLGVELGLGHTDHDNRRVIARHPALYKQVSDLNDEDAYARPKLPNGLRPGNPAVIPLLRKLATKE